MWIAGIAVWCNFCVRQLCGRAPARPCVCVCLFEKFAFISWINMQWIGIGWVYNQWHRLWDGAAANHVLSMPACARRAHFITRFEICVKFMPDRQYLMCVIWKIQHFALIHRWIETHRLTSSLFNILPPSSAHHTAFSMHVSLCKMLTNGIIATKVNGFFCNIHIVPLQCNGHFRLVFTYFDVYRLAELMDLVCLAFDRSTSLLLLHCPMAICLILLCDGLEMGPMTMSRSRHNLCGKGKYKKKTKNWIKFSGNWVIQYFCW